MRTMKKCSNIKENNFTEYHKNRNKVFKNLKRNKQLWHLSRKGLAMTKFQQECPMDECGRNEHCKFNQNRMMVKNSKIRGENFWRKISDVRCQNENPGYSQIWQISRYQKF